MKIGRVVLLAVLAYSMAVNPTAADTEEGPDEVLLPAVVVFLASTFGSIMMTVVNGALLNADMPNRTTGVIGIVSGVSMLTLVAIADIQADADVEAIHWVGFTALASASIGLGVWSIRAAESKSEIAGARRWWLAPTVNCSQDNMAVGVQLTVSY